MQNTSLTIFTGISQSFHNFIQMGGRNLSASELQSFFIHRNHHLGF